MKITTKGIENYERELTIEFDAAELEKTKKRAAKKLSERISIPGFRKGKIPLQMLERQLGKGAILNEAADILIQKGADEAIKMFNIIPVTEIKPEIITCEDGKDFVYKLTFTPYPEVKLGEYKGLEVEKKVKPVTDKDVEDQLEHLRSHHANLIDAAEDDVVADGDFVTLDFEGTIDGEKFSGGEGKDYPLTIGSHSFIDNFEEQLIGAKVGEEREVKVTFPEDYHMKDLAEKPAVFKCKINKIKHRELPALDDEFAKKASKFETLEELRADLRKNMEKTAEYQAVQEQQDAIIEKAVENMEIDLPPVMVEDRITNMINEFSLQLQMQGLKLEQYMSNAGLDMEKLREEYREAARKNLLADILLDEVARAENIQAEQSELELEVGIMANMYRTNPKQIVKILQENRRLPQVRMNIRRRKAAQFLMDNRAGAEKSEATEENKSSAEQNLFENETE